MPWSPAPCSFPERGIDAHGNVGRLPVDRGQYGAGPTIEAIRGIGVADGSHSLTHQIRNVHVRVGGDLSGDNRHSRGHERLTGYPARGIAREDSVEHRIGNLISHLVGVTFSDRLGREDVTFGGGHVLSIQGWNTKRGGGAAG